MIVTPEEYLSRVDLISSETIRFSDACREFTDKEWQTPTFCPGWAAEDVVSHVTTGGAFYANSIKRALEGLPPEPPYGADAKEFHAMRRAKGEQLMALPRSQMMDAFDMASEGLQHLLDDLQPEDLGKLGYHPRGLTRIDAWIGLRLVELVIHDWDIRMGKDPEARVTPHGVEGMLTFVPANQARFFGVRDKPPFDGRFLFRSTEPESTWTLTVSGEKAEESSDTSGSHDAVITADGEGHLLLIFGRAKREAMESTGRLDVEGNLSLADQLLSVLYTVY